MRENYLVGKGELLCLENSSNSDEIIILFPVTKDANEVTWRALISLIKVSQIDVLILIDKTSSRNASMFFMREMAKQKAKLFILEHSLNEGIHESQGYVVLDEKQWIMQLHDDDHWQGRILKSDLVDDTVNKHKVVEYGFIPLKNNRKMRRAKESFWPARMQFNLVSQEIWNLFSKFIEEQNYKVAGSADIILSDIAHSFGEPKKSETFCYFYNSDNWTNRRKSRKLLTKMSKLEGWGKLSSIAFSLIGRELDRLSIRRRVPRMQIISSREESESIEAINYYIQKYRWRLRLQTWIRYGTNLNKKQHRQLLQSLQKIDVTCESKIQESLAKLIVFIERYSDSAMSGRIRYWQKAIENE